MLAGTLVVGTVLTLLEGGTYAIVGVRLGRTRWAGAPLAWRLFTAWWLLIGANKLLAGVAGAAFAVGALSVQGYVLIIHVNLLLLAASLFCLFSYLVYLFSGTQKRLAIVAGVYAAFWFTLEWSIAISHPIDVGIGAWRTFLVNEHPPSEQPILNLLNLAMLFLPQVVAAGLYLGLLRRVTDRTQRYRIALVSVSIIGWSLSITLVAFPGFGDSAAMQVGSRVVGALAGVMTLLAYTPPAWLRERLDVESVRSVGLRERAERG